MVSNIGSRLSDVESMVAGFQNNMDDMNKNIANLFKVVYIWSKILLDYVIYLKLRKIYGCYKLNNSQNDNYFPSK